MTDQTPLEVLGDYMQEFGSPYPQWIGQRIAIYGPRFIWRGELVAASQHYLLLRDVFQVKNTGDHDSDEVENEVFFADEHCFHLAAVSNAGPVRWA